jgi:plasmid stability protein
MLAIMIRNLSDETHRALMARAACHRRSTEAEVLAILEAVVSGPDRPRLGTLLAAIGHETGADPDVSREQAERGPIDLS